MLISRSIAHASLVFLLTVTPAAADGVSIILPEWMSIPSGTIDALASQFGEVRTHAVGINAWRGDQALMSETIRSAMPDEPEILIILGSSHTTIAQQSEWIEDVLQSDWNSWTTGERISVPGDPLNDASNFDAATNVLPLGLGFGDPTRGLNAKTVFFPMGWEVSLPVVSAGIYTSGGVDPNDVVSWFYDTDEGTVLRSSLSVIPFDGSTQVPEITMKPWIDLFEERYSNDSGEDPCGCDDDTATCDPDTYSAFVGSATSFFDIDGESGRGVMEVPRSTDSENSNDGCGCEAQVLWNDDIARLRAHAASTGEYSDMFEALQGGQQFIVFSCDPD